MTDDQSIPEAPVVKEAPSVVKQRRLLNRWSLFALVFVSAVSTVLYVSNVIAVNKLNDENLAMRKSLDSLQNVQQSLNSEIYRLQSAEHVTRIATEKLGMIPPPQAPVVVQSQ